MEHSSPQTLGDTLEVALTQCQEQVRLLHDQSERIERLQKQNDTLRKELDDLKERQVITAGTKPSDQKLHDLFQQNLEYRAEVQHLKQKLKALKEKASCRLSTPITSPLSTPATLGKSAQGDYVMIGEAAGQDESRFNQLSRPRKRQRLGDKPTLDDLCPNKLHLQPSLGHSKNTVLDKTIQGIPLRLEDGEDLLSPLTGRGISKTNKENHICKQQLNDLLAAPRPAKSPLGRPPSTEPPEEGVSTDHGRKLPKISNIDHFKTTGSNLAMTNTSRGQEVEDGEAGASIDKHAFAGRFGLGGCNGARKSVQPIRARPLGTLSLRDFRPNPKWINEHGMTYDDFIKGSNGGRIKALAATLPAMPGQRERQMTDHDLLKEFLGHDSSQEIENLTEIARYNLLEEARIMHVAQTFGKQRVDYDRDDEDAFGFWSTDMPSTQEEEENRERAQKAVEAEIARRRNDALIGRGAWIFADEAGR